jgi:DNA polymerase V
MDFLSSPSVEEAELCSLDKEFIDHPTATFFMRMEGHSMVNAFISDGSLLVVDRSLKPKNMDIVVVTIEGETAVRYLRKNDLRSWLLPANPKFKELLINEGREVVVLGVVTAVVTEPKRLAASIRPC